MREVSMRRFAVPVAAALSLAAAVSVLPADTTRTLRIELAPGARGAFAVENLAGVMRITAGSGDGVVAVATIHAEDADAAGAVQLVQVEGENGAPTLRVRYPLERYGTIRYPGERPGKSSGSFLSGLFGGSSTTTKYDDRKVKIGESSGTLLYADVEVQVPRRAIEATFRNLVGTIDAAGIQGKIKFDTSSGDVKASDLHGSFTCDTGSGDCTLIGFEGDTIDCDVGSGDVILKSTRALRISADTGSGDVRVEEADAEELVVDTGSGDVQLQAMGSRLQRVKADTGSGDVRLRLDPDASFEARADQGSGDLVNRFRDAEPIVKNKVVVGYRRGDGRIRIDVDTGSGDFVLEPGR
jgi:hypothetical protein